MTLHASGRRLGVLAATATALALAAPSAASAATTASFADGTITLTGDAAGDRLVLDTNGDGNLTFAGNADLDTATPGPQTLATAAIGSTRLRIEAGGGNDQVVFAASTLGAWADGRVSIDGGDGDDTLAGTNTADALIGGAGNDRLVPGRNGPGTIETTDGGTGNDTHVWNEGEGSDVADGGDGADAVEVNGSEILPDVFTLARVGARTKFDRTNRGPANFTIDAGTAERFVVNGSGGDDEMSVADGLATQPGGVLATLNGGTGVDRLTGGSGPDTITGGDGEDVLAGGGGDDAIDGGRGNDAMAGGGGDDELVWNNGDGDDDTTGDDGYDTTVVNGAAANETYVMRPAGAITRLDRTLVNGAAVGLFNMEMATEALELNALGGNDDLTTLDGTAITMRVDGGAGDDALRGAGGDDTLFGGSGNDALTGGSGFDVLDGSVGDDAIAARDGAADLVRCAAGTDTATLDPAGIDAQSGCEAVDQPAAPAAPGAGAPAAKPLQLGRLAVTTRTASVRRSGRSFVASVRVSCPAGGTACAGTLALTAARPSAAGARIRATLATKAYRVAAGRSATVRLTFSDRTRAFAKRGVITTTARTQARTVDGVTTVRSSTLRLKLPARR